MKRFYVLLMILFAIKINAQILISPYIVYMDERNRYGSFIVQNESNENYEISIFFRFGYPEADSTGEVKMKYMDEASDSLYSIKNYIRAFPKKFVLTPKQRQVIRMTVRPDADFKPGTYWARIVTSASQEAGKIDSVQQGISTNIRFVLNQVTTVIYRKFPANTGVSIKDVTVEEDSANYNVLAFFERNGNSPFYGDYSASVKDSAGNIVVEEIEPLSIYHTMASKIAFNKDKLDEGKYFLELKLVHNEKRDIPESNLISEQPIIKIIDFEVSK